MALYIKDATVDSLAERYQAAIKAKTKTEAVRQALEKALDKDSETTIEKVLKLTRELRALSPLDEPLPDDKEFLDSLYEDD
jgi:antitoxin VapB